MILFPIDELLDEQRCHDYLMNVLHPDGLDCPQGHALAVQQQPHDRHRAPVMDYRCRECGAVFNLFTGTLWSGTRYACRQIVLIIRGIGQGVPTAHLAKELKVDESHLRTVRHEIQQEVESLRPKTKLRDTVVEADELYQNAGEKGKKHDQPEDPPRRRANKVRGHGTWDNDRPPVAGVVGRKSGKVRLHVCPHSNRQTLQTFVEIHTRKGCTVNTDEWHAYDHLPENGRGLKQVCHTPGQREWARDEDGDGVREVHNNTMEGIWTGLRNFLRPFRGVSKTHLHHYVAVFEWIHNFKEVTAQFLRALMFRFTLKAC
jgi:transposase